MLLKLAKNNPTFQFILLLIVALLFGLKMGYSNGFNQSDTWIWLGFNLITAIASGWIITRRKLSRNSGIIAIVSLCMLASIVPIQIDKLPWGIFFFLLAQYNILNIYATDKPYPAIFNAGVFWSATTLVHPELTFTLPCLWIIMIAYSLNQWREWAGCILGIAVPYIIMAVLNYSQITDYTFQWNRMLVFGNPLTHDMHIPSIILYILTGIISIFSIASINKYLQDLEINERKKSSALIVLCIYTIIFALSTHLEPSNRFILSFPFAFFCTKFFVNSNKHVYNEIAFILILILGIMGS